MGVRPRPLNPRASRYVGFKINWRRLIDEIAATVGTDPVAFHLRYLTTLCGITVVKAAAERGQKLTSTQIVNLPQNPPQVLGCSVGEGSS